MSSTPTTPTQPTTPAQPVPGNQAPNQIELLWDRYKSIIYVAVLAVIGSIVALYALEKVKQGKTNKTWSEFAAATGLAGAYSDQTKPFSTGLSESVASLDLAKLKAAAESADEVRRPFLLLAVARRAMHDKDWAAAEAALAELETKFPNHDLVRSTPHPVQTQDLIHEVDEPTKPKPSQRKELEKRPAVAGSAVSLMRNQIAAAKAFAVPAHFAPQGLPAEADKFKFDLSNGGSFTLALEQAKAPKHCDAFRKLVESQFWVGLAIDEIQRPTKTTQQPRQLHFGLESSRGQDDRDKWTDTEPSKNPVDYEKNDLSHFPGAVSARPEKDNKSCADRIWISVDDASRHDGERVIFARVVEGLDALKAICEASMTATEEEQGRGKPAETVRITAVTLVK
jgi:cyclophilin family peptidyl-prolyl cis-trans isomerase